jgi:hypothetical protein
MATHIDATNIPISASTTSAQGTLPVSNARYIRVTNPTTALCYVAAGTNPTATSANVAVGAYSTEYFERDPNTDLLVAVLLSTGTGTIAVNLSGTPGE